jgi:hypothetical protein
MHNSFVYYRKKNHFWTTVLANSDADRIQGIGTCIGITHTSSFMNKKCCNSQTDSRLGAERGKKGGKSNPSWIDEWSCEMDPGPVLRGGLAWLPPRAQNFLGLHSISCVRMYV